MCEMQRPGLSADLAGKLQCGGEVLRAQLQDYLLSRGSACLLFSLCVFLFCFVLLFVLWPRGGRRHQRGTLGENPPEKPSDSGRPLTPKPFGRNSPSWSPRFPGWGRGSLFYSPPFRCLGSVYHVETEVQRGYEPCPRSVRLMHSAAGI